MADGDTGIIDSAATITTDKHISLVSAATQARHSEGTGTRTVPSRYEYRFVGEGQSYMAYMAKRA